MTEEQKKTSLSLPIAFLLVSLVGLFDAAYLLIEHLRNAIPPCSILEGCGEVTTSAYATIFGIPVALLGVVYYLSIFFLTVLYLDRKDLRILRVLAFATIIGLLASSWFVFVQFAILHAVCIYCMGSAVTSAILFILGMIVLAQGRGRQRKAEEGGM